MRNVMDKRIYVEPSWRMHSGVRAQFLHPPEGYQYVVVQTRAEATSRWLIRLKFPYLVHRQINRVIPPILIQSFFQGFGHAPPGTSLTYALYHIAFRKEPWIAELENVCNLCESNYGFLRQHRAFFERKLGSPHCRKLLVWSDPCRKSLEMSLNASAFGHKIVKVPLAVPAKKAVGLASQDKDKIKLLFVNSANVLSNFRLKGGVETLEAFSLLSSKYPNVELVMRTDLPPDVRERYRRMRNVRFIEELLPFEQLEQEFRTADVFLAPSYMMAVFSILDAMSYGLPVVATDIACASEYVDDGRTGMVIPDSLRVPGYVEGFALPSQPELRARVNACDNKLVEDLVKALTSLVENPEKRKEMGAAGRWEIEHGKFSFQARNDRLKRIFDEATADGECKSI